MNWIIRNLLICTLLAFGVYAFIFFSETGEWPVLKKEWEGYLLAIFLVNLGGIAFTFFNRHFNRAVPWHEKRALRFTVEMVSGLVVFSLLASIFYFLYIMPNMSVMEEGSFWEAYWDGVVKFAIVLIALLYIASMVNFSVFSYNQYTVAQVESLSVEREQLHLQFEALKSQLNPHFLFNALNTISSLTYRDINLAEKYIRKLADSYRYILHTNENPLVTLGEEIEMVRSFFYMQLIKYEGCIRLNIDLQEDKMDTLVPPLSVQMLIENALKHNLICEEKKLTIDIFYEGDRLTVKNNIIEKPVLLRVGNDVFDRPKENGSHKIGLENIRKRYRYFINRDIEISRNDDFIVKLPLIDKDFEKTAIL
jgi:sensor histidine kinase YesM